MPTSQLAVTVAGLMIKSSDKERTVLTLANMDNANIIYISDEPGKAITEMFPIFPETFISLVREHGDEPQKAWYGRTAVQSTIAIMEGYGEAKVPKTPEPSPQQPNFPGDAPNM